MNVIAGSRLLINVVITVVITVGLIVVIVQMQLQEFPLLLAFIIITIRIINYLLLSYLIPIHYYVYYY